MELQRINILLQKYFEAAIRRNLSLYKFPDSPHPSQSSGLPLSRERGAASALGRGVSILESILKFRVLYFKPGGFKCL